MIVRKRKERNGRAYLRRRGCSLRSHFSQATPLNDERFDSFRIFRVFEREKKVVNIEKKSLPTSNCDHIQKQKKSCRMMYIIFTRRSRMHKVFSGPLFALWNDRRKTNRRVIERDIFSRLVKSLLKRIKRLKKVFAKKKSFGRDKNQSRRIRKKKESWRRWGRGPPPRRSFFDGRTNIRTSGYIGRTKIQTDGIDAWTDG